MERRDELLVLAVKAALLAGEEIKIVYSRDFTVELKDDRSPLTEADKRAHLKISETLEAAGIPILSEEGRQIPYDERKNWNRLWIVDPLDGTKEFIKRNGEFTVNIALIENGFPVLGVVYAPAIDTLYFSSELHGSYKIEISNENIHTFCNTGSTLENLIQKSIQLPVQNPERPFTIVASRSHPSAETSAFIEEQKKTKGNIEYISKGSSLKICLVAEGAADVYPRFAPTMEWDTAAGQAIAEGAGKKLYRVHPTERMGYNREDLLNPWFIVD